MNIIKDVNEAVDLILEQKPLVIFQGSSEWGPRALGNRSILFDPRNKNAKDIVNEFKKREWWRPLADNSCRIQTVSKEQNKEYYNLLNAFYSKTNVPLLLNTSFNLAGYPIVEKIEDITHLDIPFQDIYLP